MRPADVFRDLGVTGAACAALVDGGEPLGHDPDRPMTPASVMKVSVALTVHEAIEQGLVDGTMRLRLTSSSRTPGPVGVSLLRDDVDVSVRDLVTLMLTISDNAATDALIRVVGLERINRLTSDLGLTGTHLPDDLHGMLDSMARQVGFVDYPALANHDPAADGPPDADTVTALLSGTSALDPRRGARTTASDMVRLLQLVWNDTAASPAACFAVRSAMARQLTRHRIATGFGSEVTVAAKSGGLMGVVRNEVGVVTLAHGTACAVAVLTRSDGPARSTPADIDAGIGVVARLLVEAVAERDSRCG